MADATKRDAVQLKSTRFSISKGLITIGSATILLFVVSAIRRALQRLRRPRSSGMLPIASVLAVAGLGQMLAIQQGGIDLSVAGGMSLAIVIVTHNPDGVNSELLPEHPPCPLLRGHRRHRSTD